MSGPGAVVVEWGRARPLVRLVGWVGRCIFGRMKKKWFGAGGNASLRGVHCVFEHWGSHE